MIVRIASVVLRVCALVALALGILFWTGNPFAGWRDIHMTAGILLVLALWVIAFARITQPGGIGGALAAVIVGVALAAVGMTQARLLPGANHWIIQVVHLALALLAVGLGEMLAGRAKKAARAAAKVGAR